MTTPIPQDVAEAAAECNSEQSLSNASVAARTILADFALTIIATQQQQAADPFSVSARFVPDEQGGHLVAHGKVWRVTGFA